MKELAISEEIVEIEYETEFDRAVYTFIVGVELEALYRQDILRLEEAKRVERDPADIEAIESIQASLRKSLEAGIGNNPAYTKQDLYEHVAPGFKVHRETGEVYVFGILTNKLVLEVKKERPVRNSSQKTVAKDRMRKKHVMSSKFREFRVDRVVESVSMGAL
jgi:hypothetical protein